jgi:hypothetical protein
MGPSLSPSPDAQSANRRIPWRVRQQVVLTEHNPPAKHEKLTEGADAGRVTVDQGSSGTPERRMDC